jgi:hypothetical protein
MIKLRTFFRDDWRIWWNTVYVSVKNDGSVWLGVSWGIISNIVFYYLIYLYWHSIVRAFVLAYQFLLGTFSIQVILPVAGFIFAFFLYLLRSLARIQYGITEIAIGTIAMIAASNADVSGSYRTVLIQIAAGVYIIIRGLDNIKVGIENSPSHPIKRLWNQIYGKDNLKLVRRLAAARRKRRMDRTRQDKRYAASNVR